jgi:hypothetical protein
MYLGRLQRQSRRAFWASAGPEGVLAGRNVARIGAAQPEAFQVAHQGVVNVRTPRSRGISGSTAERGVG